MWHNNVPVTAAIIGLTDPNWHIHLKAILIGTLDRPRRHSTEIFICIFLNENFEFKFH